MHLRAYVGVPVAAVLTAAVLLAGCNQGAAVRSDGDSGAVATPGTVDALDVRVGDCFTDAFPEDDIAEVSNVDAVPCDETHNNEIYALFDLPDGEYPGEDEVIEQSQAGCMQRFEEFTGSAYGATRLDVSYLFPVRQSWEVHDDREVVCAVYDPFGRLEGSVEGAGADFPPPTVGDCVNPRGKVIPCARKHDAEIFLTPELKGDDYPGDKKVTAKAERRCVAAFKDYVGIAYAQSTLEVFFITPDEQSWDAGDRRVICSVKDPSGPMKGSVRSSA